MECNQWPEPVIRVQALAQSGLNKIPERFVKPESVRPIVENKPSYDNINIPLIDLKGLSEEEAARQVGEACREWGFFQVVNHGVREELMKKAREVWREFFMQPLEEKEKYANSPTTYEGYGSRLGIKKGAILDWSDYFFLHYMPSSLCNHSKWPSLPPSLRYIFSSSSSLLTLFIRNFNKFSIFNYTLIVIQFFSVCTIDPSNTIANGLYYIILIKVGYISRGISFINDFGLFTLKMI